jgi:hypothetical protein
VSLLPNERNLPTINDGLFNQHAFILSRQRLVGQVDTCGNTVDYEIQIEIHANGPFSLS